MTQGTTRRRPHPQPEICTVTGCDKPAKQHEVCMMHLYRMRRTGTYDQRTPVAPKTRRTHTAGYELVHIKEHLLADSHGYVYEHRSVLFDIIGFGPHRCHWCSATINWRSGLEVDHVDHDRANNSSTNLVPSCHGCNTRRTRRRSARSLRDIEPAA